MDANGAAYFWLTSVESWRPAWDQGQIGSVDAIAVHTQAEVWALNSEGEIWRTFDTTLHDNQWHPVVEVGPDDNIYMQYIVQPGDNLSAIVRRVSGLTELENSQQISQLIDQIVAENRGRIPHLTRNLIHPGDLLTLPFFASGCGEVEVEIEIGDMALFDAGYNPLYLALENAYPPEVGPLLNPLLNYCHESINAALAWLTSSQAQTSQALQAKIMSSQRRWQHFLDESDEAMQSWLDPIVGSYPNDSGFRQPDGLVTANLLRGRYAQLNRMVVLQKGTLLQDLVEDEKSVMGNAL